MITFKKLSGFAQSTAQIRYLSPYTPDIGYGGKMKFYPHPIKNIFDVEILEGSFCVYTYPHNDGSAIATILSNEEAALKSLLSQAPSNESGIYTLVLEENSIRFLEEKEFTNYGPRTVDGDEMFIFGVSTNRKFPSVFVVPAYQRVSRGENILDVLARISHVAMEPVFESKLGDELAWALVASAIAGKYKPMPDGITGVQFSANGEIQLPVMLNTSELHKLSIKFETLKVAAKTYNEALAEESPIEEASVVVGDSYILKEATERREITLSDLVEFGIVETVKLLSSINFRVDIRIDIPGVVQKMCIADQKVHFVPGEVLEDMDPEDFFGAPSYYFVCHASKESFPQTL